MKRRQKLGLEILEGRYCLTVAVAVDDGDLVITGDADGAVEITAVDATTYEVRDNGVVVATATAVSDDIRIAIDAEREANDTVTLNLAGQTVDQVMANLGGGDNSLVVQGGTIAGNLTYRGGEGDDALEIAADATISGSVQAKLGDGQNSVTASGSIGRDLIVKAGDGDDSVALAAGASVGRSVLAQLGDGDNVVSIAGSIGRDLAVNTGIGDDLLSILAEATVGRSVAVSLGSGDNAMNLAGAVAGNLAYRGGEGSDAVTIAAGAAIDGNVRMRLGAGDNTVSINGSIGGNLAVTSANENDTVDIADTATVGGETTLTLGEEAEYGPGGHCGGGISRGPAARSTGQGLLRGGSASFTRGSFRR